MMFLKVWHLVLPYRLLASEYKVERCHCQFGMTSRRRPIFYKGMIFGSKSKSFMCGLLVEKTTIWKQKQQKSQKYLIFRIWSYFYRKNINYVKFEDLIRWHFLEFFIVLLCVLIKCHVCNLFSSYSWWEKLRLHFAKWISFQMKSCNIAPYKKIVQK